MIPSRKLQRGAAVEEGVRQGRRIGSLEYWTLSNIQPQLRRAEE